MNPSANSPTEQPGPAPSPSAPDYYHALFHRMDQAFCVLELLFDETGQTVVDCIYRQINPVFSQQSGLSGDVVGRRGLEVMPDLERFWFDTYGQVARTGESQRLEQYVPPVGRWFDVHTFRVGGPGSREVGVLFHDVTARKRYEASLALLAEISQDLVGLTSIDETMAVLGAKLGAHFQASACLFNDVDEAAGRFVVRHDWHRADVPSLQGEYRYEDFHTEEFRRASLAGATYVVRDGATDPRVNAASLAATGIGAFVNVPLVRDGQWRFNLAICDAQPRDWRPDEVDLLQELTARVWTRLEHARAEEALRESEARFRAVANLVPDLLWRSTPGSDTTWYNQRWYDYTGQTPAEAARYGWTNAIHPADRAASRHGYRTAVGSGQPLRQEHRIRSAQGEYRWFQVQAHPLRNEHGRVTAWYGAATDIHARKLAEQDVRHAEESHRAELEQQVAARTHELRQSRNLLHAIAEAQSAYVNAFQAIRDESGRIVDLEFLFVNSLTTRVDGGRPLAGRRYLEAFPEAETSGLLDAFRRVIETGVSEDQEVFYDDGQLTGWFRNNATPLGDGVLSIGEDITARKQAELERLKNLRLLEQAEAVADLGSWDYDRATGALRWSDGMYRLFGLPPGQPVTPNTYLDYVLDADRPRAEQLVQHVPTGAGGREETLRFRVGEAVKTVRIQVVVLPDEAGGPGRVLGVDLDISALQRLEADNLRLRLTQQQALFEAVQAAQEEERKRMAESLHNGIGQVLYATKLRLDQLHIPALHTLPALVAARQEADHLLSEAIRQTRALSHELVPLTLEQFGLAAALRDISRNMSTPQLRLHCQVLFDEDAPPLSPALQLALYRMAQELVLNIGKHARGATEASLELETMPGWVLLRAADNGPGFATAPAADAGLGLRSMRDRVALLGGQLEIGSARIGGAYVRIRIPCTAASPA